MNDSVTYLHVFSNYKDWPDIFAANSIQLNKVVVPQLGHYLDLIGKFRIIKKDNRMKILILLTYFGTSSITIKDVKLGGATGLQK